MSIDTGTPKKFYLQATVFGAAILAAAITLMIFTPKAKAQTPLQVYVGVHGGYSLATTEASVAGISLDGIGSRGFAGGVHGGIDAGFAGTPWFLGVFADYTWQKVDATLGGPGFSATARLGDSWTAGSRLGYVNGAGKYYVLMGYTQTESGLTASVPLAVTMPTFKGLTYGAGTEYALAKNLSVGLEARYTRFESANVGGLVDLQPKQLGVMARLNIQLGNMPSPLPSNAPLK